MKLDLKFDITKILNYLRIAEPYFFSIVLIGIFAFTAYFVNAAINIKPAATATTVTKSVKILFDKNTIQAVKNINVVSGQIPAADIGKSDPFSR